MKLEIMRLEVKKNDRGYQYIDFGSEYHGRKSFRLWINRALITDEASEITGCGNTRTYGEHVAFPCDAQLKKTEKGTLVLKPSTTHRVFYLYAQCGFRGGAEIEILEPYRYNALTFRHFRSPLGATGRSIGMLVEIDRQKKLMYKWTRSGRLYGSEPTGITEIEPDLTIIRTTGLSDGIEALTELEEELK